MPTQQGKLYRSGVNFKPNGANRQHERTLISDYGKQLVYQKQNSRKGTLQQSSSQANLKAANNSQTNQCTKDYIPILNVKQVQNSSFMSIDDAYLNPKFQKKKDFPDRNFLHNNLTEMQSDTQSLGGRSVRTFQGQDQYYKYWKTKAHQYLEQNFKLREENKKLRTEIENMIKVQIKQRNNPKDNQAKQDPEIKRRQQKSFSYLENIFKRKLDELENQNKQKSLKLISLQDKVLELNRKVLGQQERTQLIQRLGSQIDLLTKENISLKKQLYQAQMKDKPQEELQQQPNGVRNRYRSKEKNFNKRKSPDKFGKK